MSNIYNILLGIFCQPENEFWLRECVSERKVEKQLTEAPSLVYEETKTQGEKKMWSNFRAAYTQVFQPRKLYKRERCEKKTVKWNIRRNDRGGEEVEEKEEEEKRVACVGSKAGCRASGKRPK